MSTPMNMFFKDGNDYLYAYCRHDGKDNMLKLKNASLSDLKFIYKEIYKRKDVDNICVDMLNGELDDENGENHGVVSFAKWINDEGEFSIKAFRGNKEVITKTPDEMWDYITNVTGEKPSDWGGYNVYVDFDREKVGITDEVHKAPKFTNMKSKDSYGRYDSTEYDPERGYEYYKNGKIKKFPDYEDHFSKMGLKGQFEYGDEGMEESTKTYEVLMTEEEYRKVCNILDEGYRADTLDMYESIKDYYTRNGEFNMESFIDDCYLTFSNTRYLYDMAMNSPRVKSHSVAFESAIENINTSFTFKIDHIKLKNFFQYIGTDYKVALAPLVKMIDDDRNEVFGQKKPLTEAMIPSIKKKFIDAIVKRYGDTIDGVSEAKGIFKGAYDNMKYDMQNGCSLWRACENALSEMGLDMDYMEDLAQIAPSVKRKW